MPRDVYIHGSWSHHRQRGGWAVIALNPDGTRTEYSGTILGTSPQGAEVKAAIEALTRLPVSDDGLCLHTDSRAIDVGVNERLKTWKNRAWRTVNGRLLADHELWAELDRRILEREDAVAVIWSGGYVNELRHDRAHALAMTALHEEALHDEAPPDTSDPVGIVIGDPIMPPADDPGTSMPIEIAPVPTGEPNARIVTALDVTVDRRVVEAFATALVTAYDAEGHTPVLATTDGRVRVVVHGAMGTIGLQAEASGPLTDIQAIQAAVMLLAGAHAVRAIEAHDRRTEAAHADDA
jgi:ribonuclease HI